MKYVVAMRRRWMLTLIAVVLLMIGGGCTITRTTSTAPGMATGLEYTGAPIAPSTATTAAPTPTSVPALPTATTTPPPRSTPQTPTTTPTTVPTVTTVDPTLSPIDPVLAARLQRILDQTVANNTVPGAVLSVSIPDHRPWAAASGLADRAEAQRMLRTTPYRIGSITKMFTAVVVLQLVEEKHLDLDDHVGTWLPDVVPHADTITVRQLLNHTSGIPNYLEDPAFVTQAYRDPERVWEPQELVDYAMENGTVFPASTQQRWAYSNTNYVILGMLVEEVTGRTLAEEIRERILDPLEMKQTVFPPDEPEHDDQARGYVGRLAQEHGAMSFVWATGNMVSTTGDLHRFARALFDGSLLEPQTRATMLRFVAARDRAGLHDLEYGLGVMRTQFDLSSGGDQRDAPPQVTVLGHIGGWGGFRSALWYVPEHDIVIELGLNQANADPVPVTTRVLDAILTHDDQ